MPIEAVQIQRDRYVIGEVDVMSCDDVLQSSEGGAAITALVPCGQIGIRQRPSDVSREAAASGIKGDVERPRVVEDERTDR